MDSELCRLVRQYVLEFRPEMGPGSHLFLVGLPFYTSVAYVALKLSRLVDFHNKEPGGVLAAVYQTHLFLSQLKALNGTGQLITSHFDLFQNANGQPFSSSAFSRHMKGLLMRLTGRAVSINGLRSAFLTWAYSQRWVHFPLLRSLLQ